MLRVFINLLYTHTIPNNHYCSTYMMAYPHLMAKHCLIVGRKSGFLPNTLRHEFCLHVAVKVWWRDLQSCWECSSALVIHPYNAKQPLLQHLHYGIPPLDGQTLAESWQKIEIFPWSEAWNLPIWGCKSMVEGSTIMLRVFINLLYIHTMPNNHYCSTCML